MFPTLGMPRHQTVKPSFNKTKWKYRYIFIAGNRFCWAKEPKNNSLQQDKKYFKRASNAEVLHSQPQTHDWQISN